LLEGDAFTLSCTVSNNGLGIKTISLIDTGANGYTFVDTKFAKTIERFLGVKPTRLKDSYKVRGFDGQQATLITQYLELTLVIDQRRVQVPMLIVSLEDHDMILSCK
jgi:predicted aspartyl protease